MLAPNPNNCDSCSRRINRTTAASHCTIAYWTPTLICKLHSDQREVTKAIVLQEALGMFRKKRVLPAAEQGSRNRGLKD